MFSFFLTETFIIAESNDFIDKNVNVIYNRKQISNDKTYFLMTNFMLLYSN